MSYPDHLSSLIQNLPDSPGIYQYFDKEGKIIYVGKAKVLKKRVASYFNKDQDSGKTRLLVKNINDIKFIITQTETDALLLENSLIKKHQPKFNINLKDDKTYPWIVITNERFPKVFSTRKKIPGGGIYFGPYANGKMMYTLLDLIRQLYQIRNCKLVLSEQNIKANKFKVCLEYHIKNCKGPCEEYQTEPQYNEQINDIKEILRGNISIVLRHLKEQMHHHAQNLEFEKAQEYKEKLNALENYQSKSTVVSPTIHDVDVFSYNREEDTAVINYFKVNNGAIIQSNTIELKCKLDESDAELLLTGIVELRNRYNSYSHEIIVPFIPEDGLNNIEYIIPQRGDKKQLLELSQRNLDYYLFEKKRQLSLVDPERHTKRLLQQMMKDLRLKEEPRHIECFDNSNIQGAYPVAAMTVFKDTRPSKKDYRHFNIKTVEGPNDFASMEEIIYRRYKRVLEEGDMLPQLIVIDGGKGQLGAAINSLNKLGLMGKVGIIGIAKKLEEIYYPGDSLPLYIDKKSETLKIIQQIRDEAHRFGITHHRSKRDKGTLKTELTNIKGISDVTASKLLRELKSVKRIKESDLQSLISIVGNAKAQLVYQYFHPTEPS
jgi:excinuclease ABC subunit C